MDYLGVFNVLYQNSISLYLDFIHVDVIFIFIFISFIRILRYIFNSSKFQI